MARKFDLNQYETVKERKERFRKDHVDGRIVAELIAPGAVSESALFVARIYKDAADQEKNLPLGVGYAFELRDRELSISNSGTKYASVNYTSWTENAEESAVGRALDNAGYASSKGPSREEMAKVERMSTMLSKTPQNEPQKATEDSTSYGKPTLKMQAAVWAIAAKKGWDKDKVHRGFGVESLSDATFKQVSEFIDRYGDKQ